VKGMIGGLGSGKTRTGAEAFVDLVLENPGCDLLMAGPTHEMTRDLVVPAFEHAMPRR
jgi:phage terminase large subunit-like protein